MLLVLWLTNTDASSQPCSRFQTLIKIVLACVVMHNMCRVRYPGQQNALLDREGDNHELLPGEWRQEGVMHEMDQVAGPTLVNRRAKKQRIYLKNYVNTVAAVPWQRQQITID